MVEFIRVDFVVEEPKSIPDEIRVIMKRLSQFEMMELFTISQYEPISVGSQPNRFIVIRYNHLNKRGLISLENGKARLTNDAKIALRKHGISG